MVIGLGQEAPAPPQNNDLTNRIAILCRSEFDSIKQGNDEKKVRAYLVATAVLLVAGMLYDWNVNCHSYIRFICCLFAFSLLFYGSDTFNEWVYKIGNFGGYLPDVCILSICTCNLLSLWFIFDSSCPCKATRTGLIVYFVAILVWIFGICFLYILALVYPHPTITKLVKMSGAERYISIGIQIRDIIALQTNEHDD